MGFPSHETVRRMRDQYPVGTRVELLEMNDAYALPIGTKGTVVGVDSIANLLVSWDNGSSLNVVYGIDKVRKLSGGNANENTDR